MTANAISEQRAVPRAVACYAGCLIAAGLLLAGCSDAVDDAPERTSPTSVTASSSAEETGLATPADRENPIVTKPEADLLALLTRLGVANPGVPEHGFRDAWASGEWSGRLLIVHSSPAGQAGKLGKRLTTRSIRDTDVDVHVSPHVGVISRFTCGDVIYDVSSIDSIDNPQTGDQATELKFATRMLADLDCP